MFKLYPLVLEDVLVSSMTEVYLSSVSNRMSESIRFLTVFSPIFMPLIFIVGVYGINFEFMPELKWPWGYPVILLIMLSVAGSLMFYFRSKGLLSKANPADN